MRYLTLVVLFGFVPRAEPVSISIDTQVGIRTAVLRQNLNGQIRQVRAVITGDVPVATQLRRAADPFAYVGAGLLGAQSCPGSLLLQTGAALGIASLYAVTNQFAFTHLTLTAESEDGEKVTLKLNPCMAPLLAFYLKRFLREGNPLWESLPPLSLRLDTKGRVFGLAIKYRAWMERNPWLDGTPEGVEEAELGAVSSLLDDGRVIQLPSVLDLVVVP